MEKQERCKIILKNMDCMEAMAGMRDNEYDLCICDPPYRDKNEPDQSLRAHKGDMRKWGPAPKKEYFDELFRISKKQIIWGGNYFTNYLEPNNNWIIWYKNNDGLHFSMCEMAWCSIRKFDVGEQRVKEHKKLIDCNLSLWEKNGD